MTSITLIDLPTNGGTIYVALYTQLKGEWREPFYYTFTAGPPVRPVTLASVANSASYGAASVAPGEIVTLFGAGMGPASLAFNAPDAGNRFPDSLAGAPVLFNGTPAPLIPVGAPHRPGNQHHAGNLSRRRKRQRLGCNPDRRLQHQRRGQSGAPGSIVAHYVSGLGRLNPAQPSGSIVAAPWPELSYSATVAIAGQTAAIVYAGAAPRAVAGLYQINCVVAADER